MKFFAAIVLLSVAGAAIADLDCTAPASNLLLPTEWIDMQENCYKAVRNQIQKEIGASYTYLAMAAYFSRDDVNRPGFAEHFFKSAKEEREHGHTLIEYLSMRGKLTTDIASLIVTPTVDKHEWKDGVEALTDALNLETSVTKSIRHVIATCEKETNDYHLVDYLTGVYLEEQYKGQRELAGHLSTLKKMFNTQGGIGEFLFDKTL